MKKIITLFLLVCTIQSFGQAGILCRYYLQASEIANGGYQILHGNPNAPAGQPAAVPPVPAAEVMTLAPGTPRLRCNITVTNGNAIIDIWGIIAATDPYAGAAPPIINSATPISNTAPTLNQFFFNFHRDNLIPYPPQARVLYAGLNYGLLTIPLKIRPRTTMTDDTSKSNQQVYKRIPLSAVASFNLGLFFGGTVGNGFVSFKGIRNFAFTGGAFVGPTVVTLTAPSSGLGTVSYPTEFKNAISKNDSTNDNTSVTLPAISYGFCIMGTINTFGLVLAAGWDSPFGTGRKYWIYKEKAWAGVGFVANLPL